jgi:hypothetical protein
MIKIGDKVKFLNDVGSGKVIGFQSKNIVIVENEDGFDLPVLLNELIKIEDKAPDKPINRDFSKKPEIPQKTEPKKVKHIPVIIPGNDEPKFFFAFYPTDQNNPVGSEIETYLINDSNFTLLFHFCHYDGISYNTVDSGTLEPNTKKYLESFSQSNLNSLPKFWFRIIPFKNDSNKLQAFINKDISVNAIKFYKEKSYSKNSFFKGNAMIFDLVTTPLQENIDNLTDKDFNRVIESKDAENRNSEIKPEKIRIPEIVEVDLHIEELIENTSGLSNHEILQIQMDKFHSEMKFAIDKHIKRIVFIHGVGNGVLKQEIHRKLKSTYAKYFFQDASFKEYGYGATMVILRRK